MTTNAWRRPLAGLCATLTILLLVTALASAQTTTSTPGTAEVKTVKLSGTVVAVEGNQLLVKLSNGEHQVFTPPPERRFMIDGKELRVSELVPGTKLNATYAETTTPVTDRTVQTLAGKVYYVSPPTVLLTLPSGETRKYL